MSRSKQTDRADQPALVSYDPTAWGVCPTTPSAARDGLDLIALGPHLWPSTWLPADWLVVVQGDQILEQSPFEPYLRGPILFCCLKAFDLQAQYYPASSVAQADWRFTRLSEIEGWANSDQQVVYFVFCDPLRSTGLWTIALQGPVLAQVLHRQRSIESLTPYADLVG
jgi:hypothetical protein